MTKLLQDKFLAKYEEFPEHMNEVAKFTYYRTYSRFLPEKNRRETWKETCARAIEYNVSLARTHLSRQGYRERLPELRAEAEELFDNMFNLRQFLSGRTLWVGGAESGVATKYALSNFNCAFINITKWEDIGDLFYLLLVGTGVGFKSTKEAAANMKPIRSNVEVVSESFLQYYPLARQDETTVEELADGTYRITVGDSKEGWVDSMRAYFDLLTDETKVVRQIRINFNYIRPKGAKLKTFGGSASGHESLKEMFEGIDAVIKGKLDDSLDPPQQVGDGFVQLRPIHILDIGNLTGANVVVGGVRRTAEIFLMDADDFESIFAKYGLNGFWTEAHFERHEKIRAMLEAQGVPIPKFFDALGEKHYDENVNGDQPFNFGRPLHHRRMSNNSVAYTSKPSREQFDLNFELMQLEGEPAFINLREAALRRLGAQGIDNPSEDVILETMVRIGLNPCAEILLDSKQTCNLTTVNVMAFMDGDRLDVPALLRAQTLSARAGLRMTLATLELDEWDKTQKRDRLLGTSLTGWQDAVQAWDGDEETKRQLLGLLKQRARHSADHYAKELRIVAPLLVSTVKPEGTLSLVANGVSSGLHFSHAPYYIRRIRVNATDPLALAMKEMGFTVHAEVGTQGATEEERLENARTLVIDFPIESGAKVTKDDVTAQDQLDTYFDFQRYYAEHNSSNTITVKADEWNGVADRIYEQWDEFTAVSFLAHDGGSYQLAPYEAISKETYEEMVAKQPTFDPSVLEQFETGEDFDIDASGCENGACPTR